MSRRKVTVTGVVAMCALALLASAAAGSGNARPRATPSEVGPAFQMTANGRQLQPAGRLTRVGDFPTGGALTRDGRFYWAIDAGHGHDDVQIVNVANGRVVQILPLPGRVRRDRVLPRRSHWRTSPENRVATSSRKGPRRPTRATRSTSSPSTPQRVGRWSSHRSRCRRPAGGTAQTTESAKLGWPGGIAVTRDGSKLLVALNQADTLAIVDLTSSAHAIRLVRVGKFPYGVVANIDNKTAYVSNELDGTVSVVDITKAVVGTSIGVGGERGDLEAHPEGMLLDVRRQLLYVAVTNRDLVAVVDTGPAHAGRVHLGRTQRSDRHRAPRARGEPERQAALRRRQWRGRARRHRAPGRFAAGIRFPDDRSAADRGVSVGGLRLQTTGLG